MVYLKDYVTEPAAWSESHFARLKLGDARLSNRAVKIAKQLALMPGVNLPSWSFGWAAAKSNYRFFSNPKVSPDGLRKTHQDGCMLEMSNTPITLLLEDTSDFSWSGKDPISGLGPIGTGSGKQQGFKLQSVLAVKWPDEVSQSPETRRPDLDVIGLAHQEFFVRAKKKAKTKSRQRVRGAQFSESDVWKRSSFAIGPAPRNVRWVRVCDRGADIFDFLRSCESSKHGFIVRAKTNRCLVNPETGEKAGKLFDVAKQTPASGKFDLNLRKRKAQDARVAHLNVSATRVALRSTEQVGHAAGFEPPVECSLVRVWEEPGEGIKKPLQWFLLCDQTILTFDHAMECALQYAARWFIEELHKGIKTGLTAERLQFETADALFPAIAMMSIVAIRLVSFRERLRMHATAPVVQSGLSSEELQVLEIKTKRTLKIVADVALAIGALGGHLGRKGDGLPGWITLWRGMTRLRDLTEGFIMTPKANPNNT